MSDAPNKPARVWPAVLVYWLVQPIAIGVAFVLWMILFRNEESGWLYGGDHAGEVFELTLEPVFWMYVLGFSLAITGAQAVYLWPARKPGITKGRGRSIRASVAIAGLVVGLGGLAITVTIAGAFDRALEGFGDWTQTLSPTKSAMFFALLFVLVWVLPSVLIVRFCGPGRRETVLLRLSRRLLMGTAAEATLAIPVDAMMRRNTECYCAEGSFFGLTLLGLIGFVGAGPAVLLPLFVSRRRSWYRVHCNACGYDMRGDPHAPRCPECGEPWTMLPPVGSVGEPHSTSVPSPEPARTAGLEPPARSGTMDAGRPDGPGPG